MPMLLTWREPDHIAGMDLFNRTALTLHPTAAGCDDQDLTQRMSGNRRRRHNWRGTRRASLEYGERRSDPRLIAPEGSRVERPEPENFEVSYKS
jgi:hypothetical protein